MHTKNDTCIVKLESQRIIFITPKNPIYLIAAKNYFKPIYVNIKNSTCTPNTSYQTSFSSSMNKDAKKIEFPKDVPPHTEFPKKLLDTQN